MTDLCFNAFNRSAWFGVDPVLPAPYVQFVRRAFETTRSYWPEVA